MLSIEALEVRRNGAPIITDLSLRGAPGDIVGVLGQNGAGKTTLAEALVGLIPQLVDSLGTGITELAQQGLAILLIEQNIDLTLDIATQGTLLNGGRIVASGDPKSLASDKNFVGALFGALEAGE